MTKNHYESLKSRKWTEQLYQEYDALVWQYRLPLTKVGIEVKDLDATLGLWDPMSRQISISYKLIDSYSWDVVIEVLKHEMAHQLVHEHHRSKELHGALFRKACQRIGVAAWAIRACGHPDAPIEPWSRRPASDQEDRLLKRVHKLLALTESSNEHESLAAMRKVQELYRLYNIEHMANRSEEDFTTLIVDFRKKRIERPVAAIASLLVEHYFVQVIYSSRYCPKDFSTYKTIEIIGRPHNVEMAEYVLNYLRQQIVQLWKDFRKVNGVGVREKSSYMLGVLKGFREKLGAPSSSSSSFQSTDLSNSSTQKNRLNGLIKIENKALDTYLSQRFPRLTSRSVGRSSHYDRSFSAGFAEGQKLNMSHPISGTSKPPGGEPKQLPAN